MNDELISIRGQQYVVIRRFRVDGKLLLAVSQLKSRGREAYRVFDQGTRQWRALHLFPFTPSTVQHLRTLQRITRGDNEVIQILHIGRHKGRTLVLLPWIDGFNLGVVLRRQRTSKRRIGLAEAIRLLKGIVHCLSHLHRRKGIVHADVKPSNLILTQRSSLVLIDYGSAWSRERTTQKEEGDGVSPGYAAPELIRGNTTVDWRADQFSVGVILYELLTGKLPYGGLGGSAARFEMSLFDKTLHTYPSRLSPEMGSYSKRIWKEVDELASRSLALEPCSRFLTEAEWLDAWSSVAAQLALTKKRVANRRPSLKRIPLYLVDVLFRR
ncbi:MAG: protein kinase [Planctomycetota bacterium]